MASVEKLTVTLIPRQVHNITAAVKASEYVVAGDRVRITSDALNRCEGTQL